MTGAELRALLEEHWATHRGRKQGDILRDHSIPLGEPDGIEWLGAERVADRQEHWRAHGCAGDIGDEPGAAWMDGFIAGLVVREREARP